MHALQNAVPAARMVQALAGSRRRCAGTLLAAGALVGLLLSGAAVWTLHLARPEVVAARYRALPAVSLGVRRTSSLGQAAA